MDSCASQLLAQHVQLKKLKQKSHSRDVRALNYSACRPSLSVQHASRVDCSMQAAIKMQTQQTISGFQINLQVILVAEELQSIAGQGHVHCPGQRQQQYHGTNRGGNSNTAHTGQGICKGNSSITAYIETGHK